MTNKVEQTNPATNAEGTANGLLITKVDPKEFGLDEKNTKSISDAFLPKLTERDGYIEVYKNILTMEITEETCKLARRLRLDLVPVRTGIDKVHKTEKAAIVAEGKYIDALKNKYTLPIEQMEEKLLQIEEHFTNIEKAKKEKLKNARLLLLEDYPSFDPTFVDLANMDGPTFEKLLKQQEDLKKFNIQEEIRIQKEQDEKKRKAEIEEQRTAETIKLADFIVNYDNIFLSDLSEEDYQTILAKAKADKKAHDEKQAKIAADNARLAAEKKAIEDKAAKEKADADAKLKAANEKAAKEKAEADAKIKALEKEKADKEAAEKAKKVAEEKAAAEAAKAPLKTRLNGWIDNFNSYPPTDLNENETVKIINARFEAFKKWAKEEINKI
jgi:hypothetical protein